MKRKMLLSLTVAVVGVASSSLAWAGDAILNIHGRQLHEKSFVTGNTNVGERPFSAGLGLTALLTLPLMLGLAASGDAPASDVPQAEISNGELRVRLYLPDVHKGYYRGTRFDWSGVIASSSTRATTTTGLGSTGLMPESTISNIRVRRSSPPVVPASRVP